MPFRGRSPLVLAQPLQRRGPGARRRHPLCRGDHSTPCPGAFDAPWAMVGGESLSLNDIEHGKIRRFRDPRIHAALVCGSVSCPTLRYEPFGEDLAPSSMIRCARFSPTVVRSLIEMPKHSSCHEYSSGTAATSCARDECPRGSPPEDTILHDRSHNGCPTRMPTG